MLPVTHLGPRRWRGDEILGRLLQPSSRNLALIDRKQGFSPYSPSSGELGPLRGEWDAPSCRAGNGWRKRRRLALVMPVLRIPALRRREAMVILRGDHSVWRTLGAGGIR